MQFLTSAVLAALTCFWSISAAHNIQMRAHSRECFHEQLHKGDRMTVSFQVGDREFGGSGNLEIDFWIQSPNGGYQAHERAISTGDHSFEADQDGKYTYCFSNEHWSASSKEVSFNVHGIVYVPESEAPSDPLEAEVRQLSDLLSQVKDEQSYIVVRERTHRNTAESTNGRVKWWSIFQLGVLIGEGIFQVWWLKRFFENARLNPNTAKQSPSTYDWLHHSSLHHNELNNTASTLGLGDGSHNQSFGQNIQETVEVIFDLPNWSSSDQPPERFICLYPGCEVTFKRVYDLKRHVVKHIPQETRCGYFCPVSACRCAIDYDSWRFYTFGNPLNVVRKELDNRTQLFTVYGFLRKDKALAHVQKKHSDIDQQQLQCLLAAVELSSPVTYKLYRTDIKVDIGSFKSTWVYMDCKGVNYAVQKTLMNADGSEVEGGQIPLNIVTDSEGRTKAI
ncbi:MAG: hypothetical protein M1812_007809 [Candelaria pacifica]|nr:MAG: hypothetical protein M1812_007809 [Candelaria pacifica]